jgi:hypothetical protein
MKKTLAIIAFASLLLVVSAIALSESRTMKLTEYDGPRIIAIHEVTETQAINAARFSFDATKRGKTAMTIERAYYEGHIDESGYNYAKMMGYGIIEV